MNLIKKYTNWLHTRWPAGLVDKLPVVNEDGTTNVTGIYVVGDLRGIPLLKFSADGGARAVQHIVSDPSFERSAPGDGEHLDIVIIGGGVSGMTAALEARKAGLRFDVLESTEAFSTIVNFPKGKPIYTYPKDMTPAGELQITAQVKETLVEELNSQTVEAGITPRAAHAEFVRRQGKRLEVVLSDGKSVFASRVIAALGRSGNFRTLDVPGEDLDKVYNRLHDPNDFCGQKVLVVGGGDTALETAIALAKCGSDVTLSYRKPTFSRPKPENIEQVEAQGQAGRIRLMMESQVREILPTRVTLSKKDADEETIPNDVVFTMVGREAPLSFFRRSGIRIAGEWTRGSVAAFVGFVIFAIALYNWKSGGALSKLFAQSNWFPFSLTETFANAVANPASLLGIIVISAAGPAFWYTLAYSALVVIFGIKRIRRRGTEYVKVQTLTLMAIQVLPLFLLPEIILPWLDKNGFLWQPLADGLFPVGAYGHGREFWRAYGLILAWPLNVYNVFTQSPIMWWLIISFVQTLVIIPLIIHKWGKGAYCGWICSCGALAETLGDTQRQKMVHGPRWNRLNMMGQVILAIAVIMLIIRIFGWIVPNAGLDRFFAFATNRYKWIVDVTLAGVVGYGFYFWYSGRVWCRFMCPLAALMHIYARFSRFRILADKKKCISCNVCTSVCHQGIDIMNFANKGLPMQDPECVRCSACVQSCPTGVLTFGEVDKQGNVITTDRLSASLVQLKEQ